MHNPAYYFRDTSAKATQALDLVMMTNGWRRFSWEEILKDKFPTIKYPYEQGVTITGKAMTSSRQPLQSGNVNFLIRIPRDSSQSFLMADVKPDGTFALNNLIFGDTANLYFQGQGAKANREVVVEFDRHFFDTYANVKTPIPLLPPPRSITGYSKITWLP